MILPYPYKTYTKVSDISLGELKEMKIKGIILDIDGTLMKTKDQWPTDEVMGWLESLKKGGILIYVLSNNKHPERVKAFAEKFGLCYTDNNIGS